MKISRLLVFLIALAPAIAAAAPSQPAVGGTIATGETLTITGTSFGTKATAAPVRWETFDTYGSDGQRFDQLQDGPDAFWGTGSDNPEATRPKLSSNNLRYGDGLNAEIYLDRVDYSNDYISADYVFPEYKALISFWVLYDRGTPDVVENGAGQVKLFRIDNSNYGGQSQAPYFYYRNNPGGGFSIVNTSSISGISCDHIKQTFYTEIPSNDEWAQVTMEFKESTPDVADGHIKIWIDGNLRVNQTAVANICPAWTSIGRHYQSVAFGRYVGNISPLVSVNRFDDIYLDDTWARVELGNRSSYGSCTQREMQIPSEWGASSITATCNTGSFADGETVYLYVIDSDGSISPASGPLTVSSSYDPPPATTTITRPDSLEVIVE